MANEVRVIGTIPLVIQSILKPYPYLVHEYTMFELILSAWWGMRDRGWAELLYSWVVSNGKDVLPKAARILPGRNTVEYDDMLFEIFDNLANKEDVINDCFETLFDNFYGMRINRISFRGKRFELYLESGR